MVNSLHGLRTGRGLHRLRLLSSAVGCLALAGCAVGPGEFARVSEAQIASTAPLPVRAIYESAIRSTVVGLVHHPVSSTSAGIAALKTRTRELVPVEAFLDDPSDPRGARAPGTPGFERYLDGHGFATASRGTVAFHLDGAFFSRLNESIATRSRRLIGWCSFLTTMTLR